MPKLSWIIGAFNRPGRLRTCLASIADQTLTDWEAIVVDNSDNGDAILDQKHLCKIDTRIRYEHIGDRSFDARIGIRSLYTATEIGVIMTTGEWLCYPNDDSYYAPWFAERMLKLAEDHNLEFVYCDLVHGRPDIAHYALNCQPHACAIDKTNFIYKRSWYQPFPHQFDGQYGVADGLLVNDLVARGIRHGKLPQLLVVHN